MALPRLADQEGLIPAWAGKTSKKGPKCSPPKAHPRVGGENVVPKIKQAAAVGSSPRGRGKRAALDPDCAGVGLIPAWAGKTKAPPPETITTAAHPRVGGENDLVFEPHSSVSGSSPRGRGKRVTARANGISNGLIPAWAGKTTTVSPAITRSPAHPRVGGEN